MKKSKTTNHVTQPPPLSKRYFKTSDPRKFRFFISL